ncbi:MAG TPA: DNA/RNA nuclease SfsA [Firmicutes bacterium]|jgi:sugar fermentation stimulation protein A|nr:DNA/RNA nuclease SfsA [Candidatus Fermentithermobacillaceae bacterium]
MSNTAKIDLAIPLGHLEEGTLAERPNRFVAVVNLDGQTINAHVPDPGRLEELLYPGNPVMVRNADAPARKTLYDLVLAAFDDIWVCVDTRYPNRLFERAARQGALEAFSGYTSVRREVTLEQALKSVESPARQTIPRDKKSKASKTPKSRFDFLLQGPGKRPLFVEVKSVSLCVDGTGLFPDAPTLRGARHINEMKEALDLGLDACVVFIAQRQDVARVSAHRQMDPRFAQVLDEAAEAGVRVHAYRCAVSPAHIRLEPAEVPYC